MYTFYINNIAVCKEIILSMTFAVWEDVHGSGYICFRKDNDVWGFYDNVKIYYLCWKKSNKN